MATHPLLRSDTDDRTRRDDGRAYRFETLRMRMVIDDMRYRKGDLGPGDRLPDFDMPTLDGGRFTSARLGPAPVLMVFGSRTCPITESAAPRVKRLHDEFGDRVRFVFVNTREAHPGERIPQPHTIDQKWAHAEELRAHHGLRFDVAVDDIDGTVHRSFGPKPNSAYVIDTDGIIRYRAHWANDERALRTALHEVTAGRVPARGRSRATIRPLVRAVGHLPGVVRVAGKKADRDVWRAATPLAVLAQLSRPFTRLPEDAPGVAAAGTLATVVLALGWTLVR
jgi:hypothetical protein